MRRFLTNTAANRPHLAFPVAFVLLAASSCLLFFAAPASAQSYWEPAGLADTNLTALNINDQGDILAVSVPSRTLHFSSDGGSSWITIVPPGIVPFMVALDDSGFIYAADPDAFGNGLQRSSDSELTWKTLSDSSTSGCYSLGVTPGGELFATFAEQSSTGTNHIYHSTSRGTIWTKDSVGFGVPLMSNISSQSAYAFNSRGEVFVIGSDAIYRSTDHGSTWDRKSNGMAASIVKTICVDSSGNIFAMGDFIGEVGNLYRSTDDGDSWTTITPTGLPQFADFNQLTVGEHGHLYGYVAGTIADGIYRSTDSGVSWTNVMAGLPQTIGIPTLFRRPGGLMYCATAQGLFRESTALMSAGGESTSPTSWALDQNFPNPFNPTTIIQYSIPVEAYNYTSLRVYDILGREVATLVEEIAPAGSYGIRFDASRLSSGTYYYRLRSGGLVLTRRMMLLK